MMGVDFTAFKNVKLIKVCDTIEQYKSEFDWQSHIYVYVNPDFPGRADPIVDRGVYSFDEAKRGYSSGYSTYNNWREMLCEMALAVKPERVWESSDVYQKMLAPFYELINFSDCEGVIGTIACAKLSGDFRRYQDNADNMPEWFQRGYKLMRESFDIGSQNGFVRLS